MTNGVLEEYDDGTRVSLSSYAGGAAPGGSWSTLTLIERAPDGTERMRNYKAEGDWFVPPTVESENPQQEPSNWKCAGCGEPEPFWCDCPTDVGYKKGCSQYVSKSKYRIALGLSAYPDKWEIQQAGIEALRAERDDYRSQIEDLLPAVNREAVEQRKRAEDLESTLKMVIQERDATFAHMLRRAEKAEANSAKAVWAFTSILSGHYKGQDEIEDFVRVVLQELTQND